MSELWIVSAERQVELAAKEGKRAETRRRLGERLAAAFLQNTRFATAPVTRAALSMVLPRALEDDPTMARSRRDAASWERMVDAIDDAISSLRRDGIDALALGEVERDEPVAAVLRRAMNALDARLDRALLVDDRLRGERLATAIARASAEDVARVTSALQVRARHIVRWNASDGVWWRALASALERAGGRATVELPSIAKPIDASRANDAFEAVVADVARAIDDAPLEAPIASLMGDATFTSAVPDAARARIVIRRGLDAEAQARAAAAAVSQAIAEGVATDRIAIGLPKGASARSTSALARHFEEAGIALHLGAREASGSLVTIAFTLLEVGAAGLQRRAVAALLRSRAIDPCAMSGIAEPRLARIALRDLADALERTAAADADEPFERLVATATALESPARDRRGALARRVGLALMGAARTTARAEHARRARALFAEVGLGARAGAAIRGALARDEGRAMLIRAELDAYARDARVLEAVAAALDDVERADVALGGEEPCAPGTFVHEVRRALRVRGAAGAARAGAVRALALEQLAGEPLELLVVIDANDGVLPSRSSGAGLVTPALEDALRRRDARRGAPAGGIAGARSLVELAAAMEGAERVVLCHRAADDDGAALAPSPLVSWLERGGVAATLVHSAPLMGAPTTPHERDLALVAVAPDHARELAPHAARVAVREIEREAIHSRSDATSARLRMTDDLRALFDYETGAGIRPLSVTALERIARCPFQGFAAQLLGALDDDPRADDAPDRREEGILAHEALGAAFTAAAPLWAERPRDAPAIEEVALAAAAAVLERSGGALVRAALDRIRLEVVRLVALAIEDEAWNFTEAERGFGNAGDTWPALIVDDGHTRIALRGRIDRLDTSHDHAATRAVDYKRRVSLPAIVDLGATVIQVPLYAIVARRELGGDARGRYLSTVSPAKASTSAFDDRFAELVDPLPDGSTEATRTALERVTRLREGDIGPRPAAPKWCVQCGLDGACRRPRFAVTMVGREEDE